MFGKFTGIRKTCRLKNNRARTRENPHEKYPATELGEG